MRQKSGPEKQPAEDAIRDIRRATRRHFSAEEKIRVVLEGRRALPNCVRARAQSLRFSAPVITEMPATSLSVVFRRM